MKICMVIKRFNNKEVVGGAEAFAGRLAGAFVAKGNPVIVFSSRYKSSWPPREFTKPSTGKGASLAINRLSYPNLRFIRSLFYLSSLFWSLLMRHKAYDVILVNYASLDLIPAVLVKKFTSKPIVCKLAGSGKSGDIEQIKKRWFAPLVLRFLKRVDCFIALNKELAEELRIMGIPPSSVASIPNGVNTREFNIVNDNIRTKIKKRFQCPEDTTLVVSVGRLSIEKRFDTLINAVYLLREKGTRFLTIILGKGAEHDHLMEMIEEYNLHAHIKISFEKKNIARYLKAADIFVLPSRWEGLSNALLEAMATGLPCIVSDIPGNNSVIYHCENGILFDVDDHIALAGAIGALIDDPIARKRLGIEARASVCKKYSIENTAEAYLDLFSRLSGSHNQNEEYKQKENEKPEPALQEFEEVKCE